MKPSEQKRDMYRCELKFISLFLVLDLFTEYNNTYRKCWLLSACAYNFWGNNSENQPYLLSSCGYNGLEIIVGQASFMVITYAKLFEIGKILQCEQERGNLKFSYTVSIKKDGMFHVKNHVWHGISSYMV